MKMHPTLPSRLSVGLLPLVLGCALFTASPAHAAGAAAKVYRFTSASGNTSASVMTLDHPSLNGKATLRPVIAQYSTGVSNPHPVGVFYNHLTKRWQIFNEDEQNIPANAGFNVMILPTTKPVAVASANLDGDLAFFTVQKNNPQARLLVTHMYNPYATLRGTFQPNQVGLFYIFPGARSPLSSAKWSLFPENAKPHVAATYHIADVTNLKVAKAPISFRHTAVAANTTVNETVITNALTDGKPDAVLFVQHVYHATAPKNVDEVLGVRYSDGKWRIFAQDGDALPVTSEYVVAAFPAVTP